MLFGIINNLEALRVYFRKLRSSIECHYNERYFNKCFHFNEYYLDSKKKSYYPISFLKYLL